MCLTKTVAAEKFNQFVDRFLIILQPRIETWFLFGMFRDFSSGFIIEGIRVRLSLLRVLVGVERGLDDFEVLHELQSDSLRARVQAVGSAVVNGQQDAEDGGFDAMADDLHLARVHRQHDAYISRPQPVTILSVVAARESASGLRFAPAQDNRLGAFFIFIGLVVGARCLCQRENNDCQEKSRREKGKRTPQYAVRERLPLETTSSNILPLPHESR